MADSVDRTITRLRQALLLILLFGNVGIAAELWLLKHTDGVWQWMPLILTALSTIGVAWVAAAPTPTSLRALQAVMVLCIASGAVGVVQHFLGNMTYASESNPSLAGRELYIEAIFGSTPALAPGAMTQLGLIGLAFAFRHHGLRGRAAEDTHTTTHTNERSS